MHARVNFQTFINRGLGLVLVALMLASPVAMANDQDCVSTLENNPPPDNYPPADIRYKEIRIDYRGFGSKDACVYAPQAGTPGPWPGIVTFAPTFDYNNKDLQWLVVRLVREGYVAVMVQNVGSSSISKRDLAAKSAIDYLESSGQDYAPDLDPSSIGALGYSLGARSITKTQAEDSRIDAFVALDNFATHEKGDEGTYNCFIGNRSPRPAKAKALGIASDHCHDFIGKDADSKKHAFIHWKQSGVEAMQLVFAGYDHLDFSRNAPAEKKDVEARYTLAWFDRWLKNDVSATTRLIPQNETQKSDLCNLLDDTHNGDDQVKFDSAIYFDGYSYSNLREAFDCAE